MTSEARPRRIGRYTLHRAIGHGGMATVFFGRLRSSPTFSKVVAIKRLHAAQATEPKAVAMLRDEARVSSRVQHPNVVQTLDVLDDGDEVLLVMEWVPGESLGRVLGRLASRRERMPPAIAAAIVAGALRGVHAAHEAKDERGEPLELVHRDLTPSNLLVDVNGIARVLDFGVAKARGRLQRTTEPGGLKGTLGYVAPEQVHGATSRASDLFSMGVILWEALVGEELFGGGTGGEILAAVLSKRIPRPSARGVELPAALDDVVAKSLARRPEDRFATALEMALAIEASIPVAPPSEVATWLAATMRDTLDEQAKAVAEVEREEVVETPAVAVVARAPSRRPIAFGVAAFVAVVTIGLFAVTRAPSAAHAPPPVASAAPSSAPDPPAEPPRASIEAPESSPAPSSSVARPNHPAAPKRDAPRTRPATRAARDCNPPYTVDANGVRTWKRDCF